MSGIYIHIPFCKQACHYCDFHFSTNTDKMENMVQMICKELELQRHYLENQPLIETIYFGGGTPSLLNAAQLEYILDTVHKHYRVDLKELTIETNPDDLIRESLLDLKKIGFDRLSIGIQSFDDRVLRFYNRVHNAKESHYAIEKAKDAGFKKMSIDLMYGFPHEDHGLWVQDLKTAIALDPGHISSYALTIEPNTALGRWTKSGKFSPATEDFIAEQFEIMQEELEMKGYLQYEISNFGKPGAFAIHNTNYWKGIPYLGIGPSAHSYNGKSRQYNPSNNNKYLNALEKGSLLFELEAMTREDALNDYLLTSLRTMWGADTVFILNNYHVDILTVKSMEIRHLVEEGLMHVEDQKLILTKKGKLLADGIALKLFV